MKVRDSPSKLPFSRLSWCADMDLTTRISIPATRRVAGIVAARPLPVESLFWANEHFHWNWEVPKWYPILYLLDPPGLEGASQCVSRIYLVYCSLSPRDSDAYPARSAIAGHLLRYHYSRDIQVFFWECFITMALFDCEACRRVGINPGGILYASVLKNVLQVPKRVF